jgi:hypothetical protein
MNETQEKNLTEEVRPSIGPEEVRPVIGSEVRGNGKTLGLKIKAIGEAILAAGERVEFVDHTKIQLISMALHRRHEILELALKMGVKGIQVEVEGARVFVIATEQGNYKYRSGQ